MAARLRKHHQEDVRLKIQASYLINRLHSHVTGEIELTPSQIQSAKILLDKSISNAPTITESDINLTGELEHKHISVHGVEPSK